MERVVLANPKATPCRSSGTRLASQTFNAGSSVPAQSTMKNRTGNNVAKEWMNISQALKTAAKTAAKTTSRNGLK